jgi:predicted nucleotidyltransferase component of viral defense system
MVPEPLLRRRAAEIGVALSAAVREYALLRALGTMASVDHDWVLRGGTALAYGYLGIHRLSEDLDFTTAGDGSDRHHLVETITSNLDAALETPVLAQPPAVPLPGPDLERVELAWGGSHRLQIDFAWHEPTVRQPQVREVTMPYPNEAPMAVKMWSLEEIMANKWFMLDDRAEPRDLLDLWIGLTNFHVEWDSVVGCHLEKYGFRPSLASLSRSPLRDN